MIAEVSLNFSSCWRAFSSDIWFTPKNWLSPKRMRSMVAMGRASAIGLIRLEDQVDDAFGLVGGREGILVGHVAGPDRLGEGLELGRVLLAPQVEADRLLEPSDVARVPALHVVLEAAGVAQVDLELLAVDDQLAARTMDGDRSRHLPVAIVAPVGLKDSARVAWVGEDRRDGVLHVLGEDGLETRALNPGGRAYQEVHQVD